MLPDAVIMLRMSDTHEPSADKAKGDPRPAVPGVGGVPSGQRGNSGQGPDTESSKISDVLPVEPTEASGKAQFLSYLRWYIQTLKGIEPLRCDNEAEHGDSDDLLLAVLRAAGWGDVADLLAEWEEQVGFWYA